MNIKLQKIKKKDYFFLFNLRNSKDGRLASINSNIINYKEHLNWVSHYIKKNIILIIIKNKKRIGCIRLERKFKKSYVSIVLAKEYRGKGLGEASLKLIEKFVNNKNIYSIVLKNNLKSIALFKSSNYNIIKSYKKYFLMKKQLKNTNKYTKIIDQIEKVRKKNNSNWMNILRIAFKYDPIMAGKEMSKIYSEDKKISALAKKLSK